MFFLIVIFIVGVIYLVTENNKLSKEISELKRTKFCPKCGYDLFGTNKHINYNHHIEQKTKETPVTANYQEDKVKQKTYNEEEFKNNLILITGSILIILSSIIFLTSTWYTINEFIKIIVVILVLGVFLGSSYIADKYLNLKQTSKAFYYIALAYIPIALFLATLFELFGKYFSLYGLGRYIYLAVSSLVVSIIYYYCANKRKSKLLAVASIIFQLLTVSFFQLIFINSTKFILLGLLIYSSIFSISYIKDRYYFGKELHLKIINTLSISISVITAYYFLLSLFNIDKNIIDIFLNIIFLIELYILLIKILKKEDIYNFIYPILIILVFYNLSFIIENSFVIKQIFLIFSFILIYIYDILKYNKINISSFIEVSLIFIILYSNTFTYSIYNNSLFINGFILMIIFTLLNYINYLYSNKYKNIMSYIFITTILLSFYKIINYFELPIILIHYITILFILFGTINKTLEINLKNAINKIGNLSIIILTIIYINTMLDNILFLIVLSISSIYFYFYGYKKNNIYYRIISYIYLNLTLVSLLTILNINKLEYITILTTFIIIILEKKKQESSIFKVYGILQFIISYITLITTNSLSSFITLILFNSLFIYFIKIFRFNNNFLYLTNIFVIPYVYGSDILILNNFNYMYLISIIIIVSNLLFIYTKKTNQYITIFYIYTVLHIFFLEEIKYISLGILIFGSLVCYIIKTNKTKDKFKGLLYTLILILYKFIIIDLKLDDITVLNIGIYIIYLLLITRNIFKKYGDDYKGWEYIISTIIYIVALSNYNKELDGIIFVFFISLVVIICYLYKIGPVFIVSLVAILLNVLILTRTFWISIPWYIYILIIGAILVSFSIYNEIKLKKDKDFKNKINDFKNNLNI